MPLVESSGFAHVRLTVTDIERSKAFYDRVFGWPTVLDASASVNEPGVRESAEQFYGGVVYQTPQGTLFGLRPVGEARDRQRPGRTEAGHQPEAQLIAQRGEDMRRACVAARFCASPCC